MGLPQPPQSTQNHTQHLPLLAIIIIPVGFTIAILICCFRRLRAGSHDNGPGYEDPRRNTVRGGLDRAILVGFPTFLHSDQFNKHKTTKETTPLECIICLNEFLDHELLRLLPKCGHIFHIDCVDLWLASHVTCPMCRVNLEICVHNQIMQQHEYSVHVDIFPQTHQEVI
ncbi:unnamed protein product [Amaranthus hypochondriacus]